MVERSGQALSLQGQEAALDSAAARAWLAAAMRVGLRWAASALPFTSEAITAEVGLPRAPGRDRNNAVGALIGSLSRRGLITAVGHAKAERPVSHAAMLTIWQGTPLAADVSQYINPRRPDMPATIYVDREELRRRLAAAPDDLKQRGRTILRDGKPLSDSAWEDDPEGLYLVASRIADAADEVGAPLFKIPIDTEPYRSTFLALPIDLRDRVEEEAKSFEIPNFAYPGKWTVEHAQAVDRLLTEAYSDASARVRRVHALLGEHGLNDDKQRHEILGQITGDDRNSSTAVTEPEVDCLADRMSLVPIGLVEYADGSGLVSKQTGEILGPYAPDWKAFAKANGLTLKRLAELARERARVLRLPDPSKAVEITNPRLTAALMRVGRVDQAARAVEEAFAEPEPERHPANGPQEAASAPRLSVVPQADPVAPAGSESHLTAIRSLMEPIWYAPVPASRIEAVLKALAEEDRT